LKRVVAEAKGCAFGTGFDLLDHRGAAKLLDGGDLQQMRHLLRQWSETVDQFSGETVDLLLVKFGETPVERHAHIQIGNITFRNQYRRTEIDLRRPCVRNVAAVLAGAK